MWQWKHSPYDVFQTVGAAANHSRSEGLVSITRGHDWFFLLFFFFSSCSFFSSCISPSLSTALLAFSPPGRTPSWVLSLLCPLLPLRPSNDSGDSQKGGSREWRRTPVGVVSRVGGGEFPRKICYQHQQNKYRRDNPPCISSRQADTRECGVLSLIQVFVCRGCFAGREDLAGKYE